MKRQRCRVSCIQNSDGEESEIVNEGVRFFKSLLLEELSIFNDNFASSIPKLITDEDNAMLMAPFSIQEVKDVVFSMSPDKAPGPDGFNALFFQKCWSFLGEDLRLGGFVPGRETTKGATVAHEILHSISQLSIPAMILKLDMMKAYDRVNWQALLTVLKKFGFGIKWLKWVQACISMARFSIILNGSPCGFFASSRGLRQGDPLLPFLFIILVEAFSRAISFARESGLWKGISIPHMPTSHTHCLFADDTLLFGKATMGEAQTRLSRFWGFSVGQFPCKYLGLPFYIGSEKHNFWERVSGVISSRILSWSHNWLTFSGKIVLIRVVLNAAPIYLLSILKAPKKSMVALRSIVRSFLWNDNVNKKNRISLLAWDRVCAPREKGGAGIKDLDSSGSLPVAKWKSIDSLPLDQDIKFAFVDELKKRPLLFWEKDDEIIWTYSKSGEYSVKEGYNFLSLDVKRDDLPFKQKSISETVLAFIYKGSSLHNTFTPWDNWVTKHWATLQTLPLSGAISQPRPLVNREEVVWLPPPASKVKLNFDGASHGNPSNSTIGIVVSDDKAGIIKAQCQCIAYGTNNVVELHALSTGLDLLLSLHLLDVVIEGDSQVVFYMVTNRSSHSWHLKYWLDRILDQLDLFNSFTMVHCFREANKVADFLANKALDEDIQCLVEVASSSLPPHLV
ncbi:uncharacterized protein LOC131856862 [Cryptomeria japonica]|uniref:uncharacterized protein LOC131856862 n=1 Tax=Cryptomeria japonica TaxID=3369 RepID=UPI0027D9E922|nr:uncharacterized protein LOC131856862 [Cryptomeria japonica]